MLLEETQRGSQRDAQGHMEGHWGAEKCTEGCRVKWMSVQQGCKRLCWGVQKIVGGGCAERPVVCAEKCIYWHIKVWAGAQWNVQRCAQTGMEEWAEGHERFCTEDAWRNLDLPHMRQHEIPFHFLILEIISQSTEKQEYIPVGSLPLSSVAATICLYWGCLSLVLGVCFWSQGEGLVSASDLRWVFVSGYYGGVHTPSPHPISPHPFTTHPLSTHPTHTLFTISPRKKQGTRKPDMEWHYTSPACGQNHRRLQKHYLALNFIWGR